jgi:hypothetical protein
MITKKRPHLRVEMAGDKTSEQIHRAPDASKIVVAGNPAKGGIVRQSPPGNRSR